jgi:hypothetical protein
MMIFDRWGNKVYHDGGMNPHWNGFNASNGVKCQEGVYVYRLYAKSMFGEKLEYKGTVTLLR